MKKFALHCAAVALTISVQSAALADDNPPPLNSMPLPAQPDSNTPTKVALKDIGDTCKHFEKAVSGPMHEVTRREQVEYVNPWFGDAGFMDPYYGYAMAYPVADDPMFTFEEDGPVLPPRKKWLDFYLGEVDILAGMLQGELNVTKMPPNSVADVEWQVAKDSLKAIDADRQTLHTLCAATTVDAAAVMKQAQKLRDDISGIDRIRKRVASSNGLASK